MPPRRVKPLFHYKRNLSEEESINTEILKLVSKNVIEPCLTHEKGEFLSNIFTRPKKTGGLRLILDLSELNKHLLVQHFKMDNIHTAALLLSQGCYLASVDLRDAYYSISINPQFRKYLRFMWRGNLWQFKSLPNGMSTAPRLFTKVLKPVFAQLREAGHTVLGYLDDTIIIGDDKAKTERAVLATSQILSELGFVVHPDKSVLIPTQRLNFLGFTLNTVNMTITLPCEKTQDIIAICADLLKNCKPSIRQVAHVIGKLISTFPAVQYGPLFYRNLERDKILALKLNSGHFDRPMTLSRGSREDLNWWIDNIKKAFSPIRRKNASVEIRTDASGVGWGATDLTTHTGGRWNEHEMMKARNNEINYLETLAAFLGLKSFCSELRDAHVLLRLDNTTAVAYINGMGGTKSLDCNNMARSIWKWCVERDIWITAAHLPGKQNVEADERSRKFNDRSEWKLNKQEFEKLVGHFGLPEIDLFASRLNTQLDRYVSWLPDPQAESVDAFTLDWSKFDFYAFPPFCLVSHCLQKIKADKAEGLFIAPNWPTQSWYPRLQAMRKGESIILKRHRSLLTQPVSNIPHPLHERLDLLCCRLSGSD